MDDFFTLEEPAYKRDKRNYDNGDVLRRSSLRIPYEIQAQSSRQDFISFE